MEFVLYFLLWAIFCVIPAYALYAVVRYFNQVYMDYMYTYNEDGTVTDHTDPDYFFEREENKNDS